ncbi:MAG: DUF971 domain-containing protein [Deltaproteobacteria bacterium]|nr:DUF971 domain-containing protein [Deltaproteobacteria bacterium]
MTIQLTEIKRLAHGISLRWADGLSSIIESEKLRVECPCAGCREARGDTSHANPLTAKKSSLRVLKASKVEETQLKNIWAVGNYAVGVEWGDGHSAGIYTYDHLRELSKTATASP